MNEQELSLTWDLEPRSDFSTVASIFSNLNRVVLFAIDAQLALDNRAVIEQLLRTGRDFAWGFSESLAGVTDADYEEARRTALPSWTYPEAILVRAHYGSPLTINFSKVFDFLPRMLEVIRDWGPNRQIAKSNAAVAKSRELLVQDLTQALRAQIPALTLPELQNLWTDEVRAAALSLAETPMRID